MQAYALQKVVMEHFDTDCELINYQHGFVKATDLIRLFPVTKDIREIVSGIRSMRKRIGRWKRFERFVREHCVLSRRYWLYVQLKIHPPQYDKYICGSDQIWNPLITCGVSPGYFLGFADQSKNKIAYAPSFGIDQIRNRDKKKMKKLLATIGFLSVREQSGRGIIKEMTGRDAVRLIDPVFLLEKMEWEKLADKKKSEKPYILVYMMQKEEAVYRYAKRLKEKKKMRLVEISRYGFQPGFVDELVVDLGPVEFLTLFCNADYICTNSYHGLVYSIIFEKECSLIPCKRFQARTRDLQKLLHLRVADDEEDLRIIYDKENVRTILKEEREKALRYLGGGIREKGESDKTKCCGCGACAQVCPVGCIQMCRDREGFQYPSVKKQQCIHCNQCKVVCPMEQAVRDTGDDIKVPQAYGGWHKDHLTRLESSSGGAFSILAECVLVQGGIVFGCALNQHMQAVHIGVESKEELAKLRGSKYVQSDIGNIYIQVKKELERKRKVLFSGTPCQAAGLYAYLGRKDENLWIVDFICHGVPSPAVFQAYVKQMERKYKSRVVTYRFRNKDHGWNPSGLQLGTYLQFANKTEVRNYPAYKDSFMNGFLDNLYLRPSCYCCKFKTLYKSYADFSIADFWGVNRIEKRLYDGQGTSLVLVHNEHGKKLWKHLYRQSGFHLVDFEKAVRHNQSFFHAADKNSKREVFFRDFYKMGYPYVEKKYLSAVKWAWHKVLKLGKKRWKVHEK